MTNKNSILERMRVIALNHPELISQNNTLEPYSSSSIIEAFKKGRKIEIKKKNRGSFTRYCGGNVTEECIRRGKNSPDPRIRKKATFAKNARSWDHS